MSIYWPIGVVIASNVFYHICAKQTPSSLNAFFSLAVTYGVAFLISLAAFFATAADKNAFHELAKTNWTSFVFGLCIIGLEFGNLNVYRVGWKINVASLTANIGLAVILMLVGFLLYKETLSLRQIAGAAICVVGLVLLNR